MTDHIAILLAGGVGSRMGGTVPKQLLELGGRTILERAIAAFEDHPAIDRLVVLMAAHHLDEARQIVRDRSFSKVRDVIVGGSDRSGSTLRALEALVDEPDGTRVLVHDVARPLVPSEVITACLDALDEHDAASVAVRSTDTIVEVADADGELTFHAVPPRGSLRRVQTPQGFRLGALRRAYALAADDPDFQATDDCGVVLRYTPEVPIRVVDGDERNLKITDPLDLLVAEELLRRATPDV